VRSGSSAAMPGIGSIVRPSLPPYLPAAAARQGTPMHPLTGP